MLGPTIMAHGTPEQKKRYLEPMLRARRGLVPALQRAGRRLRPRRPAHHRGEGRRRLDHQRPEDLDHRRALLRLGHDRHAHRSDAPEARRHHLLHRRHEGARHRDPADQADQRRRRTSTRCSSPTCACPTRTASARSNDGWRGAITTLMNERASIGSGGGMGFGVRELLRLARETRLERPAGDRGSVGAPADRGLLLEARRASSTPATARSPRSRAARRRARRARSARWSARRCARRWRRSRSSCRARRARRSTPTRTWRRGLAQQG